MKGEDRLSFALAQLDRTQAFHSRVEGRVNVLLALNLAMATVTIINLTEAIIKTCWVGVAGVALFLMAFAFVWLILVSYSHLKNKVKPSLIYFNDIARLPSADYVSQAQAISTDDLIDDALCQVWRNAEILSVKFARTQRAFYTTCGAITVWMIFLIGVTLHTGALPVFKT